MRSVRTKAAAVGRELAPLTPPTKLVPPAHSPESLKPVPPPTTQSILARIAAASTPLDVHNALRKPMEMPPFVAVAKLRRLSQLVNGPHARAALSPYDKAVCDTLEADIERTLDDFLHLVPAALLAEVLLAQGRMAGFATRRRLVRRTAAILLAQEGRELRAAGPEAVVMAARGLQLLGHWGGGSGDSQALAELLREALDGGGLSESDVAAARAALEFFEAKQAPPPQPAPGGLEAPPVPAP